MGKEEHFDVLYVNYRTNPGPQSIVYRNWGQSLTCVPLAPVESLTSAAHLLPGLITGFQLLPGHVASETCLDLGGCLVGLWVIQGDVHDVLFLLRLVALLLLSQKPNRINSVTNPFTFMSFVLLGRAFKIIFRHVRHHSLVGLV